MYTTIKVKKTREVEISLKGTPSTKVHCVEGTLIILKTTQVPRIGQLARKIDGSLIITDVRDNNYTLAEPVIISENEPIGEGDYFMSAFQSYVLQNKEGGYNEYPNGDLSGYSKVLALPDHFSNKKLRAIADGKMKDGDKVLVECTRDHNYNSQNPSWDGYRVKIPLALRRVHTDADLMTMNAALARALKNIIDLNGVGYKKDQLELFAEHLQPFIKEAQEALENHAA